MQLDNTQIVMEASWCLYSNFQNLVILWINVITLQTRKSGNLVAALTVICLNRSDKKEVKIQDQTKKIHLVGSSKQIPAVYSLKQLHNLQS